jgi:hypothetical protein
MSGETGLLLRIEEEIDSMINEIAVELAKATGSQLEINADLEQLKVADRMAYYATKKYRDLFLENASSEVLKVLKQLSETATNGEAYQKLLFADDAARGFAFIELCRKRYDVILMNPPFGSASLNTEVYLQNTYPIWGKNILAAFIERMLELINKEGLVGAIFDRTVAIKSSYEAFRIKCFCGHITSMADTGWNVLDANVETTTIVFKKLTDNYIGAYINLIEIIEKDNLLLKAISDISENNSNNYVYFKNSFDFIELPNSIIGYNWDSYLINLFKSKANLFKSKLQARDGHNLVSFEHFRIFWECVSNKQFEIMYNGGIYSPFYFPYRELTLYGKDGYKVKSHRSVNFRNLEFQKEIGVGYGKRGEIFDAHILKKNMIFTKEGQSISKISKEESLLLLSFLNSILSQYNLNLFAGQHKASGYVNLLPLPYRENLPIKMKRNLIDILNIKRYWFSFDETCLEFRHLLKEFSKSTSINFNVRTIQNKMQSDKEIYLNSIKVNDDFWIQEGSIPSKDIQIFENYKNKRPCENLISIDGLTDESIENNPILSYEIISNLVGVAFGRWDIKSIIKPELIPEFGDIFDPLPFIPVVSLCDIPKDYPISIPADGILVDDISNSRSLFKSIYKVIYQIWPTCCDNILNELVEIGKLNSIEEYFSNVNGFFDFHYKRYTKSRREAPIYWPISNASGSYTVWLYYPKLTEQTLVSVINNYLQPKIDEVKSQIKPLEYNSNLDTKGLKELNALNDFDQELEEMKKELLHITALPYKPNHDDGVLISAAPLHNLFRHTKWRKSTEECWKALEKGEYDWAHLAYSIWPDRITKKCKKDLSMAIAHDLEDICEVKPKVKKPKKENKLKPNKNNSLLKLNF